MSNELSNATDPKVISHPRFAAFYNWMMDRPLVRRGFDPFRREIVGQAQGVVLEGGAGGGQNFPFYNPTRVVRLEAVEPDEAMLVERLGSPPDIAADVAELLVECTVLAGPERAPGRASESGRGQAVARVVPAKVRQATRAYGRDPFEATAGGCDLLDGVNHGGCYRFAAEAGGGAAWFADIGIVSGTFSGVFWGTFSAVCGATAGGNGARSWAR